MLARGKIRRHDARRILAPAMRRFCRIGERRRTGQVD
jgi:hypothetical protein